MRALQAHSTIPLVHLKTAGGFPWYPREDSGLDQTHPDLIGKVGSSYSALPSAYPLTDNNGHGTWLAGIVAAQTNNLQGIAGVAFDYVHVMPVKVLTDDGLGQDADIIQGVQWAADNGASVILM